jgi:CRP-like cAMP-binding protein
MNLRRNVSDPKLDRIRRVPGFRSMSEDELARLAPLVDECEVPEGSVLTREGAAGRSTYVIVDGYASVTVAGTPIAALGPGDHIGEMSVLDNKPRSATVVAKTAMTLLEIGPAALGELLQHPAVVRSIARGLSTRLRAADASVDATSARP